MDKFEMAFSLNSKVVQWLGIDVKTIDDKISEKFPDFFIHFRIKKNLESEDVKDIVNSVEKDGEISENVVFSVIKEINEVARRGEVSHF
tara:strand:+ start:1433 stop:1699 length:267 start_codon:yes stop_codon:yes gene_type:complete